MTSARREPVRLLLADVDGTLVTKDKVLTQRSIEAVRELRDAEVLFALTSGRPPRGMQMLIEPLSLSTPISAFNGGLVTEPDMTVLEQKVIPDELVPAIIAMLESAGLDVWIYSGAEWLVRDLQAPHIARESFTVQFDPTLVESFDGHTEDVAKLVGVSDDHDLVASVAMAAHDEFGDRVSAARSQPYYLDVTHPTANKGVVIERMSDYYGIPLEQIAVVGDQANDVLMFQRSGLSIAMGNASEEVQRQATCVTASNEDDGFAKAVEQFILPRAVAAPVLPQAG